MTRSKDLPGIGNGAQICAGEDCSAARLLSGWGQRFRAPRSRKIVPLVFGAALVFSSVSAALAQQVPKDPPAGVGNLDRAGVNGDTLTLRTGEDTIEVQVVESNILRVHFQPKGQTTPPTSVLDPNHTWSNSTPAKIDTGSDPVTISTDKMIVKISKAPVRFAIYDTENHLLLQETADGGVYSGGLRFA